MKLLEIKNNLVKLSYADTEIPVLGRFIVLATDEKSYVAQFVNLKSDTVNNFAIAKLLFTFTPDGVVDNYDGSTPAVSSEISFLPAEELLNLLPVETPVKVGNLSQQEDMLSLDISMFERNLTVFVEKDINKTTFISNCIRQLFQMKEKSVVIDTCNLFEDYPKIEFAKDFKLPLNSKMIDFIFEYELAEVDAATKAVIQDIFYAVQQYIKTLDFEFLPIDNFVDVVANQYKEIQMPELALLKNKLLKYRDANVFANTKEEVLALKEKLNEKNCSIINVKNIHESLQNEVISFVHSTLESFEKYIYLFVPLNDENSDKKLLKQMVNNNHVFTTILASSSYKYANELKQHAQNMFLFAPQSLNHDFAAYNTFLNKLNNDECIVYGKLTQGIPFIVDMADLDLDLTRDDVLGDRYQFVPVVENVQLVKIDDYGNQIPIANVQPEEYDEEIQAPAVEPEPVADETISQIPEIEQPVIDVVEEPIQNFTEDLPVAAPLNIVEKLQEGFEQPEMPELKEPAVLPPVNNLLAEEEDLDDILPAQDDLQISEESEMLDFSTEDITEEPLVEDSLSDAALTEDDLNFIEDNQIAEPDDVFDGMEINEPLIEPSYQEEPFAPEQTPVVPVYPADENPVDDNESGFEQGDSVTHPRYGRGVVEKIIKYGNKTLCSISFENVGRRLLDPSISELTKI